MHNKWTSLIERRDILSNIQETNISQITTEILLLKQQTAQNIIEIGKRLIQVKEMLPHGEWGKWLEEKVEFSKSTAYRFINAAEQVGNFPALGNMAPTKVFALLDLPPEEREEFIQSTHEVHGEMKTVDEMTSRELQKVIKEKQQAEEEAARLKNEKKALENENLLVKGQAEYYKELTAKKEETIQDLIKNKPEPTVKEVPKVPDDYVDIKRRLEEAETRAKVASDKLKTRDKQLKDTEDELKAIRDSKKALIGTGQETDLNLTDLTTIVIKLIKDLTPLKYQSYLFEQADEATKNKWLLQLNKVDELLLDIKSAIHGGTCIGTYKVE
jgi:hypothetical protein